MDIVIEYFQAEVDHLKSSMDDCIAKWDFVSAEAFKKSLIATKRKLQILKSLENPHYEKISGYTTSIPRLEKMLKEKSYDYGDHITEAVRKSLEEQMKRSIKGKIEYCKYQLSELQKIKTEPRLDDDQILEQLDNLQSHRIQYIDFELKPEKAYLRLQAHNDDIEFKIYANSASKIEDYIYPDSKLILLQLGYDLKTYSKTIKDFKNTNRLEIMEELAVIFFEVFSLYGDKQIIMKVV